MKWTIDWNTDKREIDTGNNNAKGVRMKYNRLGTMQFFLEAEGCTSTVASVHVNDADSVIVLSKKLIALGTRLERFACRAARKAIQPFVKTLKNGKDMKGEDVKALGEAMEDVKEIIHEG